MVFSAKEGYNRNKRDLLEKFPKIIRNHDYSTLYELIMMKYGTINYKEHRRIFIMHQCPIWKVMVVRKIERLAETWWKTLVAWITMV
jgi:hypothetical protein